MSSTLHRPHEAIGNDVVATKHGDNVVFRNYLVDRPGHTKGLRAAEAVLEVLITLPYPVGKVWPVFKNFNAWMNRFGYVWDGLPAEKENDFVYLGNTGSSNDMSYGSDGSRTKYVVRKVVPEQLIYFDSLPLPLVGKDGVWTGHNLMSLHGKDGITEISVFMEHTWHSETMTIEELRAEARAIMFGAALEFWRDYFVPDLTCLLKTGKTATA